MNDTLLNWYQMLQLLALGPCLFMAFFLAVAGRRFGQVLVPVLYFLAMSCHFLLPLRDVLNLDERTHAALLLGASAEAALSFLLIVQFMTACRPAPFYWAILAVPLIGGSQIAYASLVTQSEVCIYEQLCMAPMAFHKLYNIFSISLTCLLAVIIYRRLYVPGKDGTVWRTHLKYALVLALIGLNLMLLCIDLLRIAGHADMAHAQFAKTVVRIGFIYLTFTFIFRMFDDPVELAYERIPLIKPSEISQKDLLLAAQLRTLLAQEKIYRSMDLDREKIARRLTVTESSLSRIVNRCFHENVSMLVNQYRVEEAKQRLAAEAVPITVIAFEVGFSSIPSFNRVFRQMTDMSPSQYRSLNQAKPQ